MAYEKAIDGFWINKKSGWKKFLKEIPISRRIKLELLGNSVVFSSQSSRIEMYLKKIGKEKEYLSNFLTELTDKDIVFDIGAFIGLWSVFIAKKAQSVVAFEPFSKARKLLRKNIRINKADNVTISPFAVAEINENVKLFTTSYPKGISSLRLVKPELDKEEEVQQRSIDKLIEDGFSAPTAVKIDVEGAEKNVILGMSNLLRSSLRPRLLAVEIHPDQLRFYNSSPDEVETLLLGFNYRLNFSKKGRRTILEIYKQE